MGGFFEGLCGRGLVAELPVDCEVTRRFIVEQRCAVFMSCTGITDGRPLLVVDHDQLRRILGQELALRNDHGDVVADVSDSFRCEGWVMAGTLGRAILVFAAPAADHGPEICSRVIGPRKDADHAGGRLRIGLVYRHDARMRVG